MTNGRLRYALGDLAALPRAAVVVEDRCSALYGQRHARPALVADALAEYQVRWPAVPIVFCETRALAEECTYRNPGRRSPVGDHRTRRPTQRSAATGDGDLAAAPPPPLPSAAEIRAWARRAGLEVSTRGRLPPAVWDAWRAAHASGP